MTGNKAISLLALAALMILSISNTNFAQSRNSKVFRDKAKYHQDEHSKIDAPETLRLAQERLHAAGFYQGPIDGAMTPETRQAIMKFQYKHHLNDTGRLDLATTEALKLNIYTVNYERLRAITYAPDSKELISSAQQFLTDQSFYHGPITGELDAETVVALRAFQREFKLPETGQLDDATSRQLGLKPVKITYKEDDPIAY